MDDTHNNAQNVLIVELNEFNTDLLKAAIKNYHLPNLEKLLQKNCTHYKTSDRYNSGYLEPWVQWVSIHTGTSSQTHKIKHLGDVPNLAQAQSWEVLSDHNITTGVWGVMNGARREKDNVLFFLPDPWTFDEPAFPPKLNQLLDLPRYVSKNYRNLKLRLLVQKALKLIAFIGTSGQALNILKASLKLISSLLKRGGKHYIYISWFDYVSTLLFMQYKHKFNPRCSILFLNSLAHLQHHHWKNGAEEITNELLYGLQYIDKIFGLLTSNFPEDEIVVHNGLSQMNTNHETPWVLYRQKDPLKFLQAMQLYPVRVEQHMTHDGHAFFKTQADCDDAYNFLCALKIEGENLFHIEKDNVDPTKLFYQLSFTGALSDPKICFYNEEKTYSFFKYFDRIVTRTGRHIPIGTVISEQIHFPNHMFNHEFNKYIHNFLSPESFPLRKIEKNECATLAEAISD